MPGRRYMRHPGQGLTSLSAHRSAVDMRPYNREYCGPLLPSKLNPQLDCLILPATQAHAALRQLRQQLQPGQIAFMGEYFEDNIWWPERIITPYRELVVGPGSDQFDCLGLAGMDAKLVPRLRDWDRRYGIEIMLCDGRGLSFELRQLPADLPTFVRELYDFCPDPVDAGWAQSLENWEEMIATDRCVHLHW